jgi:RNA polymerase sigma-70 factor (ECF subfamily)
VNDAAGAVLPALPGLRDRPVQARREGRPARLGSRPGTVVPLPRPDTEAAPRWALVERAQAGDRDAFAQIYRDCYPLVWRYIYRRVGIRHLADDLAADVFARALRGIGTVSWQGRDIRAWIITITRNLVADWAKSGRYRFERVTDLTAGAERAVADGVLVDASAEGRVEDTFVNTVARIAAANALHAAIDRLPNLQGECLRLRFLSGLTMRQTADKLGTTCDSVKQLQHRAVRRLRRDPLLAASLKAVA